MLDVLQTIWLGGWYLFKMLAPGFIGALPIVILDFYVPGSLAIIGSILCVMIFLFWVGIECRDIR